MRCERGGFLEAAGAIARAIAASAVWDGDRCNWVGASPRQDARGGQVIASLGADLYGGTSGVALFLAEAGARLEDDGLRVAGLGAVRHALDLAGRIGAEQRDGLYLGPIGVAYASARVAGILDSAPTLTAARELLRAWRRDAGRSPSSDVMSGCAGAVVGLVALADLVEERSLLAEATRIGDELLTRASREPAGWSWAQPGRGAMHHLCGISHGAAGIGLALAELFAVTGASRFGEAAERAFDYERSWFDPVAGTWPDLRGISRRTGRAVPAPSADSWCNGSAGIALSRMRAAELLGTPVLDHDAALALAACERRGTDLLRAGSGRRLLALPWRCGHRRRAAAGGRRAGRPPRTRRRRDRPPRHRPCAGAVAPAVRCAAWRDARALPRARRHRDVLPPPGRPRYREPAPRPPPAA